MSKYMDIVVAGVSKIQGGYQIKENTGKELAILYRDGMRASDVEIYQRSKGITKKLRVSPHARKGYVYTFDRTVPDPGSVKGYKQNKVSVGVLIAECEAVLAGGYSPTYEYNHKLRVADFRDLDEPERVGARFGEIVTKTQNSCHDNLVTRVLEDTGIRISVSAVSQAFGLLALNHISEADIIKYQHIRHTSPTGEVWYEILV